MTFKAGSPDRSLLSPSDQRDAKEQFARPESVCQGLFRPQYNAMPARQRVLQGPEEPGIWDLFLAENRGERATPYLYFGSANAASRIASRITRAGLCLGTLCTALRRSAHPSDLL